MITLIFYIVTKSCWPFPVRRFGSWYKYQCQCWPKYCLIGKSFYVFLFEDFFKFWKCFSNLNPHTQVKYQPYLPWDIGFCASHGWAIEAPLRNQVRSHFWPKFLLLGIFSGHMKKISQQYKNLCKISGFQNIAK